MTSIYTALYGRYDTLRAQTLQDIDVDWVCFSDVELDPTPPWRVVVRPSIDDHPRMSAKRYKMCPWDHIDDDASIWIDANIQVTSRRFARRALEAADGGIGVWRHPQRDCIYDEAVASLELAPQKYAHQPLLEQVEHYRRSGHPAHAGLYVCGVIARQHRALVVEHGEQWLGECERWTHQDQVSFPVVSRRVGIVPSTFPYGPDGRGRLVTSWVRMFGHDGTG